MGEALSEAGGGLGNAQRGEVEFLRQMGIQIYVYSIEEYQLLVDLALANRPVSEDHQKRLSIIAPRSSAFQTCEVCSGF